MRRTTRRSVQALLACLGLLLASSPTAPVLAGAGQPAGVATGWITVSGPVHSSAQPGLARLGSQLQVVWSETDDDGGRGVWTRLIDADGAIASPIRPVITGWPALLNDPKVIGPSGTRRVVFAGIHPDSFSSYTGPAVFADSDDGESWTLGTGSLSQSTAPGSGGDIAALDAEGTPIFAKGGFSGGVILHRGVDPTVPATAPDFRATELQGAPIEVSLARDRSTDDVYVAWYSLGATDDDEAGTFVQRIWPQPNGSLLKAPGSSNGSAGSIGPGQPVALAERVGGGVWLAYLVGYPTSSTIRLWKVGTPDYLTIDTGPTSSHLCLTPADEGRLWLGWRTVGDHRLHVVRTNREVTRLGSVQHFTQPGGLASSVHLTACEGSAGPLSLVVNAQTTSESPTIYAREVLPALSAKRSPKKLDKGRVTVTVMDAGDPVQGASVTFRKRTFTTDASGKAVVVVKASVRSKRYTIAISKPGYEPTSVTIRVT